MSVLAARRVLVFVCDRQTSARHGRWTDAEKTHIFWSTEGRMEHRSVLGVVDGLTGNHGFHLLHNVTGLGQICAP